MDSTAAQNGKESMVDPFLVEALQNPRHRLTILRMEIDIQRFLHNARQQHFEFQHFPTSYLRLAAHRVAQHYGMQTMLQDTGVDGMRNRILVKKTAQSKQPAVCLSEIPAKQSDCDKMTHIKIAIKPRPNNLSANGDNDNGIKCNPVRSVEERKEEYDKARARIFSDPSSPESGSVLSYQASTCHNSASFNRDGNNSSETLSVDVEKGSTIRDGITSSRVAIFRDIEKDRTDPDYDRSYERYVRNLPSPQSFSFASYNMQKLQLPFVQYDAGPPQFRHIPTSQASHSYKLPSNPVSDPFSAAGLNHISRDITYMQWPNAALMYANSYGQTGCSVFQAPSCQQPLSFDYSQNH